MRQEAEPNPHLPTRRAIQIWLVASAAAAVLVVAGASLPTPPSDPGEWVAWLDRHGAATALMALVRLGALAGAGYVAVVSLATAVARRASWPSLARLVDSLTAPALRRALHGVAGLSLVLPIGTASAANPDDSATIRRIDDAPSALVTTTTTSTTTTLAPGRAGPAVVPTPPPAAATPMLPSEGPAPPDDVPPGELPHTT